MIYSDTTNNTGIVEFIRRLTNTNTTTYPIKDLTADFNTVLGEYLALAMSANGSWQINTSTGEPIGQVNLVNGTRTYAVDQTYAKVFRVFVYDADGNKSELKYTDTLEEEDITEELGIPERYDLFGDFIRLYPTPDYDYVKGLEIVPQIVSAGFLHTDTTKVPPLPLSIHPGLAYGTAYIFAIAHNQPNYAVLKQQDLSYRGQMLEILNDRLKHYKPRMTARATNHK